MSCDGPTPDKSSTDSLVDGPDSSRRLDLFKTLGDNTRYTIYLELARSPRPLTTAEIADTINLHPNTVRPHLERMRDTGLVVMDVDSRGEVGRPQHRYTLASEAPSLGLEPPVMPMLARMLVDLTARLGCTGRQAHEVGFDEGAHRAARFQSAPSTLEALVADLDALGFDPIVTDDPIDPVADTSDAPDDRDQPARAVVAFGHCPFGELAREHPGVVCRLHQGIVDGMVATMGGATVERFATVTDEIPCHAVVAVA